MIHCVMCNMAKRKDQPADESCPAANKMGHIWSDREPSVRLVSPADRRPSITRVKARFDRFGPCEHCGSEVTRVKTFTGTELVHLDAQARNWGKDPLLHAHCEGPYWTAHIDQEET